MTNKVYVFLADGFEEIEALAPVDILRRANVDVVTVSINGNPEVTGAHKIDIEADVLFEAENFEDADMIVLPGGMPGTSNLNANMEVKELVIELAQKGVKIAAICAAPMILGQLGLLVGKRVSCYPGNEEHLKGAILSENAVEVDGNIITGNGPGAAMEFSLKLVDQMKGKQAAADLAEQMMVS